MTWPRVRTCLRVQELKEFCVSMLWFQRYEAKTKDESSFSQLSRVFSKLTIVHCIFKVASSAFIFSGIVGSNYGQIQTEISKKTPIIWRIYSSFLDWIMWIILITTIEGHHKFSFETTFIIIASCSLSWQKIGRIRF